MEHTIFGLIKKRGEIAGQHKVALKAADTIKADLDALNRALALCGYEDDPKGIAPRGKYKQLFGRNELKLTIITMLRQAPADDEASADNNLRQCAVVGTAVVFQPCSLVCILVSLSGRERVSVNKE